MINIEIALGSLERIKNYTYNVPHEKAYLKPDEKENDNFVKEGKIEYKDVNLRYREGTDLVLKNVSFSINPG